MKTSDELKESHRGCCASECRIFVAYEDRHTRDRAMNILGHIRERFDQDIGFEITWWKLRYLQDPDISVIARHYAASADIVVFSSELPGLFPLSIMNWIETWTERRSKDGGLLVPLLGSPNLPDELYKTKKFYLQHIANRAGLDFLPQSILEAPRPQIPIPTLPDDLHPLFYDEPATKTSVNSIRLS